MSAPLPHKLDPWRAVHLGLDYAGELSLAELPRLAGAVLGADGSARYALQFGRDQPGQAVVLGQARMAVRLRCQRCLGEMPYDLNAPIGLALVRAAAGGDALGLEQAPPVAEHLEALPLGEGPIHPQDLIEDELLLSLPLVPMHPPGECRAALPPDDVHAGAADARPNPFAVLERLKDQGPKV
jgi:uncharacterized protein